MSIGDSLTMTSTPKSYTPHIATAMLAIGLSIFGFAISGQIAGVMQDIGIVAGALFIGLGIFPDIATKDATIEKIDADILKVSDMLTSHISTIETVAKQALSGNTKGAEATVEGAVLSAAASKLATSTSAN